MNITMPPGLQAIRARMQPQNRKPGLRVTNAAGSAAARVADLWIYDEIGPWGVTAQDVVLALADITAPHIVVHISSGGGDVFDGVAIYHALRNHPATVDTRVEGLAASAASFIAMAGNTVTVEPAAQVMIHDASGLCWGDAAEMTTMAALLDRISNTIAGIYAAKAGGTVEDWRIAMRAESWFSASEAVAAGLADTIGGQVADEPADPAGDAEPAAKASWDLSGFTYPGRAAAPAPKLPTAHAEASDTPPVAVEEPVESPAAPEPAAAPDAPPEPSEAAPEPPAETPSRTDDTEAEPAVTDEDTWGALVAQLTSTTAPLDVIGDALASLREATQ